MKNVTRIRILIIFVLTAFAVLCICCDKEDNGKNNYHMTAKIDGKSWASAEDQMVSLFEQNYLFISGAVSDDVEILTIQIFNFPGETGTYALGTNEYDTHCFYTSPDNISFFTLPDEQLANGTLVIKKYNPGKNISGTFSFTGMTSNGDAMVEVTDGSFYLPIFTIP